MQKPIYNDNKLKDTLELYVSKWKYILLVLIISIGYAYYHLRYSTYEYQTTASIKIQEDQKSSQLSEISTLQNYGMFSSDFGKIEDEAQIIKSRTLIRKVINDLNLNISFFVEGKIKDKEVYSNPPININFFASDSIINKVSKTLYLKFISPNTFKLSEFDINEFIEFNENEGATEHAFGDKIELGFGDIIITPNIVN